jgi:hypothetical protein
MGGLEGKQLTTQNPKKQEHLKTQSTQKLKISFAVCSAHFLSRCRRPGSAINDIPWTSQNFPVYFSP